MYRVIFLIVFFIVEMLSTAVQEKTFARLLSNPANARCADCGAKSPSWASIDFGVFVCLNCSGAHRALGPSVTRVRSTKLDTWQTEWVQLMELGNDLCNAYWLANPGNSSKPTANSPLDEIKRFVVDKYVKRKFAKNGESDPVTNLKGFRALNAGQPGESHRVDFRKLKDEDKFNTVSGGFNFETFDFRKNSGSGEKPKKKDSSFDIFNFDETPKHQNNHLSTAASINLFHNHEPKKSHGHSLDFYTISHGTPPPNPNFNPAHHSPHEHHPNPYKPAQHHNPTFNQLASMFPASHNPHSQAPPSNPFTFSNIFQQQPQQQKPPTQFQNNCSVPPSFDIFGGKMGQGSSQVPISMNINMYANSINFNYVAAPEHKKEEKKDPFGAIDQFNF